MIVLPLVIGSALAVPTPKPAAVQPAAPSPLAGLSAALVQEEEAPTQDGHWHGNLDVSLTKSEGNADIETYGISGTAIRERGENRFTAQGLWLYATQDDVRTQRRALGSLKYDNFFAEKTYFYIQGLAETNEQAALDLRWTIGAGLGQAWRDDDQWRINTEIGISWFDEEFDNGDMIDYAVIRAAWDIFTQVTETLSFGHKGEIYPSLDDKDDVYGVGNTYFETQISSSMIAKLSWLITYDNTPGFDINNQRLERVDNVYLLGVGWKF